MGRRLTYPHRLAPNLTGDKLVQNNTQSNEDFRVNFYSGHLGLALPHLL
jgi:hypothetical protein